MDLELSDIPHWRLVELRAHNGVAMYSASKFLIALLHAFTIKNPFPLDAGRCRWELSVSSCVETVVKNVTNCE